MDPGIANVCKLSQMIRRLIGYTKIGNNNNYFNPRLPIYTLTHFYIDT